MEPAAEGTADVGLEVGDEVELKTGESEMYVRREALGEDGMEILGVGMVAKGVVVVVVPVEVLDVEVLDVEVFDVVTTD